MVRIFQILAVVLAGAAAILFWWGDSDMTFVAGVFAACSFLVSIRYQMKARIDERRRQEAAVEADETETSEP